MMCMNENRLLSSLEAHFHSSQLESRRKDGKKRLKVDATPTIFLHKRVEKERERVFSRQRSEMAPATDAAETPNVSASDHSYAACSQQDEHGQHVSATILIPVHHIARNTYSCWHS